MPESRLSSQGCITEPEAPWTAVKLNSTRRKNREERVAVDCAVADFFFCSFLHHFYFDDLCYVLPRGDSLAEVGSGSHVFSLPLPLPFLYKGKRGSHHSQLGTCHTRVCIIKIND